MSKVDEEAVQCKGIHVGNNVQIDVKSKDSLLEISHTLKMPIVKCENKYAVVSAGVSYKYEE